jgi:DNA-binding NtrC family response regulator
MQILLYSPTNPEKPTPFIVDVKSKITDQITAPGILYVTGLTTLQFLYEAISKAGFYDCADKKDKIDLFRSFKLNASVADKQPRKLLFTSNKIGAVKRAINAFVTKRLHKDHPACILIVSDSIFDRLCQHSEKSLIRKSGRNLNAPAHPIERLLWESDRDPRMKSLSSVFLGDYIDIKIVRAMILKAAESNSPVLILGESGTGKDVIARLINEFSTKYKKPYKVINCSSITETLADSELFGSVKGSFTGATRDRAGIFLASNKGTLFLDEIGDLSPVNQARLLLAVENHYIRKVGADEIIGNLDVRLIAATNRNIDQMVLQGTFRDDLLFRLDTIRIIAPPLRKHPDDIPKIANHIWSNLNAKFKLSDRFLSLLKSYPWPGNVRELKTLLTSIRDIFPDQSPTREHIDAIKSFRQEGALKTINKEGKDDSRLLLLESYNRLIQVLNILRAIKIKLRPYINKQLSKAPKSSESEYLKNFLINQIETLEDLCREPIFFNDMNIFHETARYRYLMEKLLSKWNTSLMKMDEIWNEELRQLDEDISHGIHKFIWEKLDM